MRELYFATKNTGKVNTLRKDLAFYGIAFIHMPLEIDEKRSDNLREIAESKVRNAYSQIQQPCIANDSGFYLHAWNGFPRANVNFELTTLGNRGILKLVSGEDRTCHFTSCLAYYDGTDLKFFESDTYGIIAETERGIITGDAWSEHYRIFIPDGKDRTLAEMTETDEFLQWRRERMPFSSAGKFATWYLSR